MNQPLKCFFFDMFFLWGIRVEGRVRKVGTFGSGPEPGCLKAFCSHCSCAQHLP